MAHSHKKDRRNFLRLSAKLAALGVTSMGLSNSRSLLAAESNAPLDETTYPAGPAFFDSYIAPPAFSDNRLNLVPDGARAKTKELFDVRSDPAEKTNIIAAHADVAAKLERQLRDWQQSVLESLTRADYR